MKGLLLEGTFDTTNGQTATTVTTAADVTRPDNFTSTIFFSQDAASINIKIALNGNTYNATLPVKNGKLQSGVNIKANNNGGFIIGCSVSDDISDSLQVGGVMGLFVINGIATACYHAGNICGSENVGGVTGDSSYCQLTVCCHMGNVSGSQYPVTGVVMMAMVSVLAAVKPPRWAATGTQPLLR